MKLRKITHNYLKPQYYYNRLFAFFLIISISLSITLNRSFEIRFWDIFILQIVVFFFLLMSVSVLIEHFHRGEYMGPLEIYDVEHFFRRFKHDFYSKRIELYLSKYDVKTKNNLQHALNRNIKFFLSSIRKIDNTYELTIINQSKFYQYFIAKFLVRKAIHKLYLKKEKDSFKIVGFI